MIGVELNLRLSRSKNPKLKPDFCSEVEKTSPFIQSLFMIVKEFHIIPIQVIRYPESLCAKYSKVELDFFNI